MKKILREERHIRILREVNSHGQVTATGLSQDFGVSEITIRRDLRDLADEGLLRRTYGGAVAAQSEVTQPPVLQRMSWKRTYKEIIGRAAAQLVNDGDSIFIGSGSTTTYVARELVNKEKLTIVTNALNIATELATVEGITVIVIGGLMRSSELSLVGHIAEKALQEVRMDKVIMGIPAIHLEAGLTNDFMPEVMTDRALLSMTNEFILVADHTKFDKVCSAYLSPISEVTSLVTDYKTDKSMLESIRKLGVSVIVAQENR